MGLMWKALSDPTRRAILAMLRQGPRTTEAVAAAFPISRVAVMRHLSVLTDAGLISSEKRGRERWHYLNTVPLVGALREWLDPFGESLGGSLLDLKTAVEARVGGTQADAAGPAPTIDLRVEVTIEASPDEVFAAVTERPGAWWSAAFLGPRAIGLRLDPALGGHFVEEWQDGGGQLLATVTAIVPGRLLSLSGPFHLGGGLGTAELGLSESADGTTVVLSFKAFGPMSATVLEQFPNGWRTLIELLKEHVEAGRVVGIDGEGRRT